MKKTFEITFTSGNGIYSTNLIHAETAEQSKAYFQSAHACEVIGCKETTTPPKPGQPVHEVPDGWSPDELESKKTAARSAYIQARDAWIETRTPENANGDPTLFVAFCDAKRLSRQFGVIV